MNYLKIVLAVFLLFFCSDLYSIDVEKADSLMLKHQDSTAIVTTSEPVQFDTFGTSAESPSWGGTIIKMIISLVIIILIIIIIARVVKKYFRLGNVGAFPPEVYKVFGSAPFSYKKNITVIKFYDSLYLVVESENGVTLLDKIEDAEKVADIESMLPEKPTELKWKFDSLLKKNLNKLSKK